MEQDIGVSGWKRAGGCGSASGGEALGRRSDEMRTAGCDVLVEQELGWGGGGDEGAEFQSFVL